jgi:hypothetical protein
MRWGDPVMSERIGAFDMDGVIRREASTKD